MLECPYTGAKVFFFLFSSVFTVFHRFHCCSLFSQFFIVVTLFQLQNYETLRHALKKNMVKKRKLDLVVPLIADPS